MSSCKRSIVGNTWADPGEMCCCKKNLCAALGERAVCVFPPGGDGGGMRGGGAVG